MPRVVEYLNARGTSPYAAWFGTLPAEAAAKITVHVLRLEQGNMSNVAPVGEGVLEKKIDYGPGYRIYFGQDGRDLIVLLGGGSKKGQPADIAAAKELWKDYKARKRQLQKKK